MSDLAESVIDQNRQLYLDVVERRADIGGRFTDIKRIDNRGGGGVFSIVFSATDTSTGGKVAIKVFHPDHMTNPYRFKCFMREARILESLKGQKDIITWVSKLSDFTEEMTLSGLKFPFRFSYYALEIASHDADEAIERAEWPPERILCNFRTMCRAVQRIHRRGISHRDLKPGNFMVLPNGEVRLSDFGTARDIEGEAAMVPEYEFFPGDRRYSAPEMLALIHDEDPAVAFTGDIFSLGAILFELCTGTKLGVYLYQPDFVADLTQAMAAVRRGDRKRVYDQFVASVANGHTLPDIMAFTSDVPRCIGRRLNELYKGMAALDYRRRSADFDQIFRRIDQCLIVLRFEEKYRKWRIQKEQFRSNRDKKRSQWNKGRPGSATEFTNAS